MESWFVWHGSFLPQVVAFVSMTISYCLVITSRKLYNDNIRNRRQCCRCHHGHLSPTAISDAAAAAVAGVETANIAADEEKQKLLINTTSSDNCSCCCCSRGGDGTTADGQSSCKLSGAGADQDPKIKSITKRFTMIAGITMLVNLGIFMIFSMGS